MFTDAERSILRALAQKQLEAAHSSKNLERVALWKRHNALKGERPVLHIEINTFEDEVIGPRLKCADPVAREIEARLWRSMINLTEFDDDKVVPDYYGISPRLRDPYASRCRRRAWAPVRASDQRP